MAFQYSPASPFSSPAPAYSPLHSNNNNNNHAPYRHQSDSRRKTGSPLANELARASDFVEDSPLFGVGEMATLTPTSPFLALPPFPSEPAYQASGQAHVSGTDTKESNPIGHNGSFSYDWSSSFGGGDPIKPPATTTRFNEDSDLNLFLHDYEEVESELMAGKESKKMRMEESGPNNNDLMMMGGGVGMWNNDQVLFGDGHGKGSPFSNEGALRRNMEQWQPQGQDELGAFPITASDLEKVNQLLSSTSSTDLDQLFSTPAPLPSPVAFAPAGPFPTPATTSDALQALLSCPQPTLSDFNLDLSPVSAGASRFPQTSSTTPPGSAPPAYFNAFNLHASAIAKDISLSPSSPVFGLDSSRNNSFDGAFQQNQDTSPTSINPALLQTPASPFVDSGVSDTTTSNNAFNSALAQLFASPSQMPPPLTARTGTGSVMSTPESERFGTPAQTGISPALFGLGTGQFGTGHNALPPIQEDDSVNGWESKPSDTFFVRDLSMAGGMDRMPESVKNASLFPKKSNAASFPTSSAPSQSTPASLSAAAFGSLPSSIPAFSTVSGDSRRRSSSGSAQVSPDLWGQPSTSTSPMMVEDDLSSSSPKQHGYKKKQPTGVRKNTDPVPIDAPTQARNYVTPSATSRKLIPANAERQFTKQLLSHSVHNPHLAKKRRRAEADDTFLSSLSPALGKQSRRESGSPETSEGLPNELKTQIDAKRRQNTIAARRSRQKKAASLQAMEEEKRELTESRDYWKRIGEAREKQLMAVMRAKLPSHG